EESTRDAPVPLFDAFGNGFQTQLDTMRTMLVLEKTRQSFPCHARKDPRKGFCEDHRAAELLQHGGGFEPDVTSADNDGPTRAAVEIGHDPVDVLFAADVINLRKVRAGAAQLARLAARYPDQRAIADLFACGRCDVAIARVNGVDFGVQQEFDAFLRAERGRTKVV